MVEYISCYSAPAVHWSVLPASSQQENTCWTKYPKSGPRQHSSIYIYIILNFSSGEYNGHHLHRSRLFTNVRYTYIHVKLWLQDARIDLRRKRACRRHKVYNAWLCRNGWGHLLVQNISKVQENHQVQGGGEVRSVLTSIWTWTGKRSLCLKLSCPIVARCLIEHNGLGKRPRTPRPISPLDRGREQIQLRILTHPPLFSVGPGAECGLAQRHTADHSMSDCSSAFWRSVSMYSKFRGGRPVPRLDFYANLLKCNTNVICDVLDEVLKRFARCLWRLFFNESTSEIMAVKKVSKSTFTLPNRNRDNLKQGFGPYRDTF
jgi:hypothetical protein